MKLFVAALLYYAAVIEAAPRIVGGQDAPDGKYPYQVALKRPYFNSLLCGGSILNKRWILTAAHCVQGQKSLDILVGTNHIQGEDGEVYESEFLTYHEDYDGSKFTNDVGLIRVNRDIEFTDKVQPVVLASEDFTKVDYPATLSGWGRLKASGRLPDYLQEITLKVIDQDVCRRKWSISVDITNSHICTLTKYGEGACNGDSGGALVADDIQIGIVSFGMPCGMNYPDVYTRVYTFSEWIKNKMDGYEKSY